jgi:hypothetical protein
MRVTLELSDSLHRRAKARAAAEGIPLCRLVSRAIANGLQSNDRPKGPLSKDELAANRKALFKLAGGLSHLREETKRIDALIEEEFEKIER